jgi:hypothetical protein
MWYYREDTRTFVQWSLLYNMDEAEKATESSEVPVLSLAITDGERIVHDLTEFMESVRIFHCREAVPSIAHILGAWSLSSRIVLNPTDGYTVTVITTGADTLTFPMTDGRYLNIAIADAWPEPEAPPVEPEAPPAAPEAANQST